MVNIQGLDKAAVLAALHNATQPLGLGWLHDQGHMTREQAQAILDKQKAFYEERNQPHKMTFDYVSGRPIKCDITNDEFDPRWFDRDAGEGAAERAIASLRNT